MRVVDALPVTGADKIAKLPLRAEAWDPDHGAVWWRPPRTDRYEPLTPATVADLAAQFEGHGRSDLLHPAPSVTDAPAPAPGS